ncbi:Na-translocating system protein MpsB [Flavobacterium sp. Arc2]
MKVYQTIAPLWSLENFVAVNPYMGNADKEFGSDAQELAYISEIDSIMSIEYYLDKIKQDEIIESDIKNALNSNLKSSTNNTAVFMQSLENKENKNKKLPTIGTAIEKASEINNKDWQRFATQRISLSFASYFDKGQAQLSSLNNERLFIPWKKEL